MSTHREHSAVQYSAVQYSTTQHNTTQHSESHNKTRQLCSNARYYITALYITTRKQADNNG